jgi:hypothetical protein
MAMGILLSTECKGLAGQTGYSSQQIQTGNIRGWLLLARIQLGNKEAPNQK